MWPFQKKQLAEIPTIAFMLEEKSQNKQNTPIIKESGSIRSMILSNQDIETTSLHFHNKWS